MQGIRKLIACSKWVGVWRSWKSHNFIVFFLSTCVTMLIRWFCFQLKIDRCGSEYSFFFKSNILSLVIIFFSSLDQRAKSIELHVLIWLECKWKWWTWKTSEAHAHIFFRSNNLANCYYIFRFLMQQKQQNSS